MPSTEVTPIPVGCNTCERPFDSLLALEQHVSVYGGGRLDADDDGIFGSHKG